MKDKELVDKISNFSFSDFLKEENKSLLGDSKVWDNKDLAFKLVRSNPISFCYVSSRLKKDRDIILELAKHGGYSLENASDDIKDDKEIVIEVVSHDSEMYKYVSDRLKNDKDVLKALEKCNEEEKKSNKIDKIIDMIRNSQLDNKSLAKVLIKEFGSKSVFDNKEIMLVAINKNSGFMKYVSSRLKNDKLFVLEALRAKHNYSDIDIKYGIDDVLYFVPRKLLQDENVILEAIRQDRIVMPYMNSKMRKDKVIALEAVKHNKKAYNYISSKLRKDEDILSVYNEDNLEDIKQNNEKTDIEEQINEKSEIKEEVKEKIEEKSVTKLDDESNLETDSLVITDERKQEILDLIDRYSYKRVMSYDKYLTSREKEELKNDKDIMLLAIKQDYKNFSFACDDFKKDRDFVLEAVKVWGSALKYATYSFHCDKEIVTEAIKNDGFALQYASIEFKNDKQLVLEAIKSSGTVFQFAGTKLKRDKDFVFKIYGISPLVYAFVDEDVRNRLDDYKKSQKVKEIKNLKENANVLDNFSLENERTRK